MTIATTVRTAGPFTGTGAVVAYPFAFKIFQASDLQVTRINAAGVAVIVALTTGYVASINPNQDVSPGGSLTLTSALLVGETLQVTSDVPTTQPASLTNLGGFFPKVIENALDRLTIIIQQLTVSLGQALRVPEPLGVLELPAVALRANRLLSFDSAGNPIASAPVAGTATALAISIAASSGSSLMGHIDSGVGAVQRTAQEKLREVGNITPESFGAVGVAPGGSVTDQTAALALFFNSVNANPGVRHYIPRKWYGYSAPLPTINVSGAWCEGSGNGLNNVGVLIPYSALVWLGGVSGATGQTISAVAGAANQYLTGIIWTGINYNASNGNLARNLIVRSVRVSEISVGTYNASVDGVTFETLPDAALGENEGVQQNVIDVYARQFEAVGGVALRLKGSNTANISLNLFRYVDIVHANTFAIVIENADNNTWDQVRTFHAGTAIYSVECRGGTVEGDSCRGELFHKLTTTVPMVVRGTPAYAYPSTNILVDVLDRENGTPTPVYETGATGMWGDSRGFTGGSTAAGVMTTGLAVGDDITNLIAARARIGLTGGLHITNNSDNHVQLSNGANTSRWAVNISAPGHLRFLRSAGTGSFTFDLGAIGSYASDAAAAAGGVPVGGIYRNGSAVQIRVA